MMKQHQMYDIHKYSAVLALKGDRWAQPTGIGNSANPLQHILPALHNALKHQTGSKETEQNKTDTQPWTVDFKENPHPQWHGNLHTEAE